jgi:very-short-patch-repair endonuclease
LPRPTTQIPVADDHGRIVRRIDMGWPEWMVGVEYDGAQHFTGAEDYAADIERLELLAHRGWLIVRVGGRHMRAPAVVAERARHALLSRGWSPRLQMTELS